MTTPDKTKYYDITQTREYKLLHILALTRGADEIAFFADLVLAMTAFLHNHYGVPPNSPDGTIVDYFYEKMKKVEREIVIAPKKGSIQ